MAAQSFLSKRKQSLTRLDEKELSAVHKLFDSSSADDATAGASKTMGFAQLQGLMKGSVDDRMLRLIWKLFDHDGNGAVDADEFAMTFALLSKGMQSGESQIEAMFCMFDSDKNGYITREEFEAMIDATVSLNLQNLLSSEQGTAAFESQLTLEFSDENLAFWKVVKAYRDLEDGPARLARAKELVQEFVADDGERPVNLPGAMKVALNKRLAACTTEAPIDLFDDAGTEIFKLMERDTFARFKQDPDAKKELVNAYYDSATELAKDANVTFESFKLWANNEPTLTILFHGLSVTVNSILKEQMDTSC